MDWESAASGFEDLECNIDEEPLFWPFESLKLDWDSAKETWCFFSMSPRKNTETFRRNLFEIRRAEKLTRRNNREARVISRSPSRLSREPRNCEKVKESDELELEVDPIEMLLGLDAFDGREGVDSEFNQRHFSLVDSL
ncbi:hypothetical protein L484_024674 [Morus notabilis]|uniref:Uncharacterized protein n=1 Tax=Morus notabilis TaxID=981085 RepID=W9RCV3_9ROSA|nr:hypothetical protein L484_024674 [Morus notabilis]